MSLFEIFLLELAKVLQFATLSPDSHGACLVIMKEGEIPLLFEPDMRLVPNTILLSSALTTVSATHREAIYEAILINNMTSENIFSVKPDEEIIYLHRRFHPEIQATDLEPLLQDFLEAIKKWKKQAETMIQSPPRPFQIPPHPSMIQVFPYKA